MSLQRGHEVGEEVCGGGWEKFEGCIPKNKKNTLKKKRKSSIVDSSSEFKIRKLAAKTGVARIDHEFNVSFRKKAYGLWD